MTGVLFFVAVAGAALFYVMVRAAFENTVQTVVLAFDDYPDGVDELSIFFISDIHRRSIHESIIEKVRGKADVVLIGGDLTERGVPFSRVRDNLRKLADVAPVYFIWGNNDYEVDLNKLESLFFEFDVTVLKNSSVYLTGYDRNIVLIGTDFIDTIQPLRPILHSIKSPAFRIVLSHNPAIVRGVSHTDKLSLIMSGHTHGGQIRIFGIGPYEKGGIKNYPWTTLFVSNGYGTSLLPLRLGAPAEVHLITLCKRR
ncbi:metallophosphoesterase [Bacillus freudenreichii]|nr:metallophosphoesterase [Bacillus freudenreichii]